MSLLIYRASGDIMRVPMVVSPPAPGAPVSRRGRGNHGHSSRSPTAPSPRWSRRDQRRKPTKRAELTTNTPSLFATKGLRQRELSGQLLAKTTRDFAENFLAKAGDVGVGGGGAEEDVLLGGGMNVAGTSTLEAVQGAVEGGGEPKKNSDINSWNWGTPELLADDDAAPEAGPAAVEQVSRSRQETGVDERHILGGSSLDGVTSRRNPPRQLRTDENFSDSELLLEAKRTAASHHKGLPKLVKKYSRRSRRGVLPPSPGRGSLRIVASDCPEEDITAPSSSGSEDDLPGRPTPAGPRPVDPAYATSCAYINELNLKWNTRLFNNPMNVAGIEESRLREITLINPPPVGATRPGTITHNIGAGATSSSSTAAEQQQPLASSRRSDKRPAPYSPSSPSPTERSLASPCSPSSPSSPNEGEDGENGHTAKPKLVFPTTWPTSAAVREQLRLEHESNHTVLENLPPQDDLAPFPDPLTCDITVKEARELVAAQLSITEGRKVPVNLCYLIDVEISEDGRVLNDAELLKDFNFTALLVIQTKDYLQDGKYESLSMALLHEEDYTTCQEIVYQMSDEELNQYTTFDKDVQTHLLYDVTRNTKTPTAKTFQALAIVECGRFRYPPCDKTHGRDGYYDNILVAIIRVLGW